MDTGTRTRAAFGFLLPGRPRRERPHRHQGSHRRLLATLLAIPMIATAGVALAYFTSSGSGSGTAATASTVPVTLSAAAASASLYPGGAAAVTLSATNTNLNAVRVASLSLDTTQGTGGFGVDAPHSGCAVSVLSYTTQTNTGAGWTVPAMVGAVNGTLSITLPNALAMTAAAANACQGATFSVYLTAGP